MTQTEFIDLTNQAVPNDSIREAAQRDWVALKSMSLEDLITRLANILVEFAISVTIAVMVFYVGKWIIKKLYTIVEAILLRRRVDRSLTTFILSLVRIVLYFILIVTVIGILGINTSSFIAIFASVGVAIGMALSGTLQNFAGGVLILFLKPYKIGDYIEAQGYAGTVTEIQIFHTIICTPDNKSIIIPNGGLSTGSINNWSREDYRRVQWDVAISYGDDVEKARKVILELLDADERIVKQFIEDDREQRQEAIEEAREAMQEEAVEPKHSWLWRMFHRHRAKVQARMQARIESWEEQREAQLQAIAPKVDRSPSVNLAEMADSSINLVVRAWTASSNYWGVYYSINEQIYNRLPQEGLSFPFPQMDVHITPAS
ncbi:MAG: mechanosensitive ion channel [Bacteroidales bacterium]|nr:mechanosensitive ion channel [Bacteroidales bacterium]